MSERSSFGLRCAAIFPFLFGVFSAASTALPAASLSWQVPSGDWSVASNWGGSPPTSSDSAFIANGGTADITQLGPICGTLSLGGSAGSGTVQMTSGSLVAITYEYIGASGTGVFAQSGGTNNATSGNSAIGYGSGVSGTYSLSGSGLLSTRFSEYVGYSGSGIFAQSGGTHQISSLGGLNLGYNAGALGTYDLTGGSLSPNRVTVGGSGTGTFSQSGGMATINGYLYVAASATSSGSCNMAGGQLSAGSEIVGYSGTGSFVQTAGIQSISGSLAVGYNALSTGTYSLSEAGQLSASAEYVGYSGSASFAQMGGANQVNGAFYLAYNPGSSGTYSLSGNGQFLAQAEYIGGSGSGTFGQSGGGNNATFVDLTGGRYLLTAGSLQPGSIQTNGGTLDCGGGSATIQVAGNSLVDLSGTIVNSSSTSLTVAANSLVIVPANFNPATAFKTYSNLGLTHTLGTTLSLATGQAVGGWGTITDPVVCQGSITAAPSGAINLLNGLSLSANGNVNLGSGRLIVNDSASSISGGSFSATNFGVGVSGTGTFAQSGGSIVVSNLLDVGIYAGDIGSYNVSSGKLSPAYLVVGDSGSGSFSQTGGSIAGGISGIDVLYNYGLYIGNKVGGSGTYSLSGRGQLSANNFEYVGLAGNGVFNQFGGTNKIGGGLYVGSNAGSIGVYNLTAGQVSAGSAEVDEYVGYSGTGAFTQSGGVNNPGLTDLYLGYTAGANGTYSLSGTGVLSVYGEYIGYSGKGTFVHSGGSPVSCQFLSIGESTSGNGSYYLSGNGQLTAPEEYLGWSGTGTFTQLGGTNTVSNIILAENANSAGTYVLLGGLLSLTDSAQVTGGSGAAALIVGGGTIQCQSQSFQLPPSVNVPIALSAVGGWAVFDTNGNQLTLQGPITGPGNLQVVGAGTLALISSNSYTGTTLVSSGTLLLSDRNALSGSTFDSSGTGVLNFGGLSSATLGGLTGSRAVMLGNGASSALALSIGNNSSSTTFSGNLLGAGSLTKIGSGTLLLGGINSYSGSTTISQGKLIVNGSIVSPITVNNGGVLGGTGTVAAVTVNAGGQLRTGDAPGTLYVGGSLTLMPSAVMDYELGSLTNADEISMPMPGGTLNLNGQQFSDFNFTPLAGFEPGEYTLIGAGSINGTLGANTSGTVDGLMATIAIDGNNVVLTVVPEPPSIALVLAAAAGVIAWSWRRPLNVSPPP